MTGALRRSMALWRRRRPHVHPAYRGYEAVLIVLTVVAPVLALVWSSLTRPEVVRAMSAHEAGSVVSLVCVALWGAGFALGDIRGPAIRSPVLTEVFAQSAWSRRLAFGGPVALGVSGLSVGGGIAAAAVAIVVWRDGQATLSGAVAMSLAGVGVGAITGASWLAGQLMPRSASTAATLTVFVGALTVWWVPLPAWTPWGWAALAYATQGSIPAAVALLMLAGGAVAVTVAGMERLRRADLVSQALRWHTVRSLAVMLDVAGAVSLYRVMPRRLRRVRAVRRTPALVTTFMLRDAIAAWRTPTRTVVAIGSMLGAGMLLGVESAPTGLWGAVAALVILTGIGRVTDGLRHAAAAASDLPLYGVSDAVLVLSHTLFPLCVAVLSSACGGVLGALLAGGNAVVGAMSAFALAVFCMSVHLGGLLKQVMPVALLAPVPSPVGDLSVLARLAWMLDGVAFAAVSGVLVAIGAWWAVAVVSVVLGGIIVQRWRRRRS